MRKLLLALVLTLSVCAFLCACSDLFDAEILNPDEQNATPSPTPCEHEIETVPSVSATCKSAGQTEYKKCSLCGENLTNPSEIPMLPHSYDPSLSACAERECLSCGDTVPASHSYEIRSIDISGSQKIERYGLFRCTTCRKTKEESVTYANLGIPVLCLDGSLDGISKENKVPLTATYYGEGITVETPATLKWQGASSLSYDKKNYSIQFINAETGKGNKIEVNSSWGEQSKYCLKANWVDYTQARNVCSGKIYSQVLHSRNINDELDALSNGGAVDGFPLLVYINGTYHGLYTMNIPKDKWMFGMDKTGKQAIVMAEHWHDSVALKVNMSYDFASTGWDLEFCSTEDDATVGTRWVVDSFNEMMNFVLNNDGEAFKAGIDKYINVDRAIDSMLYTWMIRGEDNTAKNILWVTYDGVQWTPSVYDMDDSWGLIYHGQDFYSPTGMHPEHTLDRNMLWKRLYNNYYEEIVQRYAQLRRGIFTHANITSVFRSFINSIPKVIYNQEGEKWPEIPSRDENDIYQISDFVTARLEFLDECFGYSR